MSASNQTTSSQQISDQLHRYVFEQLDCRGEYVHLNQSLNQIFENHQYPQPVKQLLAELMAATALLTATLKFDGDISVQVQGDGPVNYAVINGDNKLQMRGLAKLQGEVIQPDLQSLLGKGHMVITITPKKGERYQGIVLLDGETIAQCVENYFLQSEQLKTRLWIETELNGDDNRAAALFLQVLPVNKVQAEEDFHHLSTLTDTVKKQELLTLEAYELINRLYHQDSPKVFEPQPVTYRCGCSKQKTQAALRGMDKESLMEQIAEQGVINVDCQFCQKRYQFFAQEIKNL